MEFRAPSVAFSLNADATEYFTKNLGNPEKGRLVLERLMKDLGNAVGGFPDWHPILTTPPNKSHDNVMWLSQVEIYNACDHTREFVRGFITCPYSESAANQIVADVNKVSQLHAYRLEESLYADNAYPVVVQALEIELEADGTIRSRDAIRWFSEKSIEEAKSANFAETWWNIRSLILGTPHGSRSSLFVNQHAGAHMRKILEAFNNSGLFGPIKERSLEVLSQKKRDKISENLVRSAITAWDKKSDQFNFELRGEICKANIRDTWDDGHELSIRVEIGNHDLSSRGFYYAEDDRLEYSDPIGKRVLAEKFL